MDRSSGPQGLGPHIPSGSAVPGAPASAPGSPEPVRVIDVAVGQRIQATVAEALGGGRFLLGWRGGLFEASSSLGLRPGRSYEFTVAATGPKIVLNAARPLSPAAPGALAAGLLGQGGPDLTALIAGLSQGPVVSAPGAEAAAAPQGETDAGALHQALQRLLQGAPEARDLELLQRRLGHDQEARVLALEQRPPARRAAEIAELRQTIKAEALAVIDAETAEQVRAGEAGAARKLVQGLHAIEADNARRADRGAPLWLPLPVPAEGGEVLDARMFLKRPEDSEGEAQHVASGRPFTVVLLLELSRLGALRVDVEVQRREVAVTFVASRPSTVHALLADRDKLRSQLEEQGLEVGSLRVQQAPEERLPVSDLVMPPVGGGDSMVDLHA